MACRVSAGSSRASQEMAERLFLSSLTIETHRRSLLTKFDVNNTAPLIKRAARLELI